MSQLNEGHRAGSGALPGWSKLLMGLITGLILAGCGGGGGGKTSTPPPAPTPVADPLALVSSTPANGATNVSPDVTPQLVFSAAVNNATANATNVSLTHAGGTAVLGLASTGTQLTVTPSQRLLPLADYTLNIGTGLTGMNGEKLASAQKLSFRTGDRTWAASQVVAPGDGHAPRIAVAADGSAIAVWSKRDGALSSIYASRFVAGSGWDTAQRIETGSGEVLSPNVAVDGKGNAIAVWAQSDGTVNSVYANRYVAGSGWGTAELIETGAGSADKALFGAYTPPQLGFDGKGNAIVVWHQQDGTTTSIYANRYVTGSGWGTAELVETSADLAERPGLGVDASGNAIAVWMQRSGTIYSVYANRYVAGSGWGTAQAIETAGDTARFPEIAVNANGDAMVAWTQKNDTVTKVYASRYAAGSGWDAVAQEIGTTEYGNQHQVAMNASGHAFVIWIARNGTDPTLYASRFTPDSKWDAGQQIGYSGQIVLPQVVIDAAGNALAAWLGRDVTTDLVFSNRFTPGGGWATTQLRSVPYISAYQLHLAIGASGDAFAIWSLWTITVDGLHAARFE